MVTFPDLQWIQNEVDVDPSGVRHLNTTGFIKRLDTSAGGALSFGAVNVTNSGAISDTALTYVHLNSLGDASGVFNMRFFLINFSSWGEGVHRFLFDKRLHFTTPLVLNDSANDVPTNIPLTQNILSTIIPGFPGGAPWVSGVGDQAVSQYVHLAVLVNNDTPVGTYGGAGAGTFRFRMLYDFS